LLKLLISSTGIPLCVGGGGGDGNNKSSADIVTTLGIGSRNSRPLATVSVLPAPLSFDRRLSSTEEEDEEVWVGIGGGSVCTLFVCSRIQAFSLSRSVICLRSSWMSDTRWSRRIDILLMVSNMGKPCFENSVTRRTGGKGEGGIQGVVYNTSLSLPGMKDSSWTFVASGGTVRGGDF